MTPQLAKLGHIALTTPDLDRSRWFFGDVLGLEETDETDGVVYLRAWGEREHHSLSLRHGPVGVEHVAFRCRSPDDVGGFGHALEAARVEVEWIPAGTERGQGDAIRFQTPSGHPLELYYEIDKPHAPEGQATRLKSNVSKMWQRGMSPRRIDHVNLAGRDVEAGTAWLREHLGFELREFIRPTGRRMVSSWVAVTSQVHDVALTRELAGLDGRLHHLAYWFDTRDDVMRAADIAVDEGLEIDLGPGMHGVSRGFFCYLKDPGSGHRIELFTGGYHVFDPDWEPIEWTEREIREGLVWWGPEYVPGRGHAFDATTPCSADAAEVAQR
jgi:biphenyl-2,3-diol 1,2-dioxygenase